MSKRKLWQQTDMSAAIEAVAKGTSVRSASTDHGVPRQTLADRINGKVRDGTKSGTPKHLSLEDESRLENYLINANELRVAKACKLP